MRPQRSRRVVPERSEPEGLQGAARRKERKERKGRIIHKFSQITTNRICADVCRFVEPILKTLRLAIPCALRFADGEVGRVGRVRRVGRWFPEIGKGPAANRPPNQPLPRASLNAI